MIRDINKIDDDIIRKKRIIEKALYSDPDIVELIDNPDIDLECPEDLVWENIFSFVRVPDVDDKKQTYICFTVDDAGPTSSNEVMKQQYVQFAIFVHKDIIKTKIGTARHDALGFVIRDIFHLSNMLGAQLHLRSNKEGMTDTNYITRTLRFELIDHNSTKVTQTNPYEFEHIVGHRR